MIQRTTWDDALCGKQVPGILRRAMFAGLWLFIVCVSVHDAYLVVLNRQVIHETELNPVGMRLLQFAGGDLWALLAAKTTGTVLVSTALLLLFWHNRRLGWVVAASLAGFQLALLLFLSLA